MFIAYDLLPLIKLEDASFALDPSGSDDPPLIQTSFNAFSGQLPLEGIMLIDGGSIHNFI